MSALPHVHQDNDGFDALLALVDSDPAVAKLPVEPATTSTPTPEGLKEPEPEPEEEKLQEERLKEEQKTHLFEVLTKITDDQIAAWKLSDEAKALRENVLKLHYGWTDDTIDWLRIGYDDGLTATRLRAQGVSDADLLSTGHYWPDGRSTMTHRIVFPWLDADRKTAFEIGRRTKFTKIWKNDKGADITPKYVKSLLHKDDEDRISPHLVQPIWAGPNAAGKHQLGLIAEGVADAVSAVQAGFPTISPVTTRFSRDQVPELLKITAQWGRTYLVPDQERNGEGMKGALDVADDLCVKGRDVRIVVLPHEHLVAAAKGGEWKTDLNDFLAAGDVIHAELLKEVKTPELYDSADDALTAMLKKEHAAGVIGNARGQRRLELRELLKAAPPYIEWRVGQLPSPMSPAQWGSHVPGIVALIASRPDEGERAAWINLLAKRTGGRVADLRKLVAQEIMQARVRETDAPEATKKASEPFTDLGNARRLHERTKGKVRFVREWGAWIVWDGKVWVKDRSGHRVRSMAAEMVRHERKHADGEEPLAWWTSCESRHALDCMVDLLADQTGIEVGAEEIDAKPALFNCANGTIHLDVWGGTRMPVLKPHDPKDLLTKLADVDYDPNARCKEWEEARALTHPAEDVRQYVQRRAGCYLTGKVQDETFELHWGPKGTGKSTFFRSIAAALGPYAVAAPKSLFEKQRFEQHPTNKMVLRGVRLAYGVELQARLDPEMIKSLTGRDRIVARSMREDFSWFEQTHKLAAFMNPKPIINAGPDDGIWDRLRVIPWEVRIRGTQSDNPDLSEQMQDRAKASGILAWMVCGYVMLVEHGESPPQAVLARTQDLVKDADTIGAFIEDLCVVEQAAKITDLDLWTARQAWNEEHAENQHEKQRDFIEAVLKRDGVTRSDKKCPKTRRAMLVGIRLATFEDGKKTQADEKTSAEATTDATPEPDVFDILGSV